MSEVCLFVCSVVKGHNARNSKHVLLFRFVLCRPWLRALMPLPAVEGLSDEEQPEPQPAPGQAPADQQSRKRKAPVEGLSIDDCKVKVSKAIATNCECARGVGKSLQNCFRKFRASENVAQLVRLRVELSRLHKQDADERAPVLEGFPRLKFLSLLL